MISDSGCRLIIQNTCCLPWIMRGYYPLGKFWEIPRPRGGPSFFSKKNPPSNGKKHTRTHGQKNAGNHQPASDCPVGPGARARPHASSRILRCRSPAPAAGHRTSPPGLPTIRASRTFSLGSLRTQLSRPTARPSLAAAMNAHRDEEAASPLIAAPGGRSHAADAHVLSAAFLFVFSAYSAAQNLQTSVNTVRAPLLPFRSQLRIPDPSPVQLYC